MEDAAIVSMLYGLGDGRDQTRRLTHGYRKRLVVKPFTKSLTGAKGRGDETDRPNFAGLINRDQIGMIELRGRKCLTNESAPRFRTEEHLRTGNLKGNIAFELRIEGEEDDAAAALAQLPAQLESANAVSTAGRRGRGRR